MGFLDGGVAAVFSGMFSGFYLDASLYRPSASGDDGAGGGADNTFAPAEAVKVQPDDTTDAMRATEGYVDTDKRYLMLAHGVAEPDTDCELGAEAKRWSIYKVKRDPASAYYDLYCHFKADA